ncbi:MAG: ABC transporter permease [Oscillospiraceae bacterium]|nr:ABC transporter permease [Oscillospiraceae bacterium]
MVFIAFLNQMPNSVAQGLIWGILAIGVYITYKLLDFADLSVDGSVATGAAAAVMCIVAGVPMGLALLIAFCAGMLAGLVTGLFHTLLGIPAILAGILTQLGLYSINIRIMGGKSNVAISASKYNLLVTSRDDRMLATILILLAFVAAIIVLVYLFFGTEVGNSLRATGSNPNMARAQGINTSFNKVLGLALSNGLVALAGGLLAQYQGSSDVKMGQGAIVIGLAAVIIGDVIFSKIFRNFALRLLSAVIGAILYYIAIAIVLRMGMSSTDLKLFSALVVALFLAVPHFRGVYLSRRGGRIRA